MRRWNGWGDDTISHPLSPSALAFLHEAVGEGAPASDATLASVLASIPPSRLTYLPDAGLVKVDETTRLRHAHILLPKGVP